MQNITVCRYVDGSEASDICLDLATDQISVWFSAVVLFANIIHMVFIMQLHHHKGTVFYTTLRLTTINDILTSVTNTLLMFCPFREYVVLTYPSVCLIATVLGVALFGFKYFVILFTIVERWLLLAKPFQYSESIFIRKYHIWVWFGLTFSLLANFLTYFLAFLYDPLFCYDTGFGIYGSPSYVNFAIILPYFLLNTAITIYSVLFFLQYLKLRRQQIRTEADVQLKQACMYVAISTAAYMGCSMVALVFQSINLAGEGQELKPWLLLINQTHGIWNILALYVALKSYRDKVKESLTKCLQCRCSKARHVIEPESELTN